MLAPPSKRPPAGAPTRPDRPATGRADRVQAVEHASPSQSVAPAWSYATVPVFAAQRRLPLQAKRLGATAGEPLEEQADRVADRVMHMRHAPTPAAPASNPGPPPAPGAVPAIAAEVLRSAGRPLDRDVRAFMEPRLGHDFSQVRVHDGALGAAAARAVRARAYAVGRDLVFGAGEYAPGTAPGRHLIAHELAHVVQQAAAPPRLQRKRIANGEEVPDDLDLTWGGDTFTLSFNHTQDGAVDYLAVTVTYKGAFAFEGPGVRNKVATLRRDIGPRPLAVKLTQIDTGVALDLYGDGTQKLRLVDNVSAQAGKGRRHDLAFRRVAGGSEGFAAWVLDPHAKADPAPDPAAALQGDLPGEMPRSSMRFGPGGTTIEIRVDGDGDQYKELLLSLRTVELWADPVYKDVPKRLEVKVRQISSGRLQTVTFTLPKPPDRGSLFPIVTEVSDGKLPTLIDLEIPSKAAVMELQPPTVAGAEIAYQLVVAGQSQAVKFPPEKAGLHKVAAANAPALVGGIASVDVTLGAYGDQFRLTVQPQAGNQALFGLSVLDGGVPDSGRGALLQLAGPLRLSVVRQGGLSLGLDLDGDGKPDLEVFDRLESPQDSDPERDRNHHIRLAGPAVAGGQTIFDTTVRKGFPSGRAGRGTGIDMQAASNAVAVSSLPRQTATYEQDLDRIETNLQSLRHSAVTAALISQATYDAWLALSKAMIVLRAEQSATVSAATQNQAAQAAAAFYAALAKETSGANQVRPNPVGVTIKNPYTGLDETRVVTQAPSVAGYGPELEGKIKAGRWAAATTDYNRLVNGLDRWIAEALKRQPDHRDQARSAQYLEAAKSALGTIESKHPTRIQAVFHPDEPFEESGRITEMPLALYYWRDGGSWHLADLTNPLNTFEDTFAAGPEPSPPPELFKKLDARIHFPKGIIHYQIPGGDAGNFRTTAEKKWTDYLAYIGIGAAVVGLTLATFGTATVAVAGAWVLAGSGIITAAGTTAEMIEKWRHGNLSATEAVIDIAQIVASLAGAAALSSSRIVAVAGGAIKAGTPWAGNWARLAVMADRIFVPMVGTKIAADVVTGVALTVETAKQLDAIEAGSGTRSAKDRAKLLLLSQAALSAGMLSLSIKGELGTIKPGRNLLLYYPPEENGVIKPPVALIGDEVAPTTLRFSQKDVMAETGEGQPLDDLVNSMKTGGWRGNPLEVVELADGTKVSIDNRRLLAAQRAGLKQVPIAVHDAKDLLPVDQRARFQLRKYAIRKLDTGELVTGGSKGQVIYQKLAEPNTYEEAALFRTANQGNLVDSKAKFPLMGRLEQPAVRPVKPATVPPGEVE